MAMGPRLDLRLGQALVMTPQLRQAIKLLQFSNMEVAAFLEGELEKNPLLERDDATDAPLPVGESEPVAEAAGPTLAESMTESGESVAAAGEAPLDADFANVYDQGGSADGSVGPMDGMRIGAGGRSDFEGDDRGIEDHAVERRSLREHMAEQLRLSGGDATERLIGACLIAMLDPAGRLTGDLGQLAANLGCDVARVEAVRQKMMRFDPPGVFARDLKECLAVQLADLNRYDPAMAALIDNLELLARRDMRKLMEICGVDAEDMTEMVAELKRLDPKPGAAFEAEAATTVVPDVLMRRAPDGGWIVELNPETLPRVLANGTFHARVSSGARTREEKTFIAEHWANATWLVKSLQQRATTILKVASEIVRQQDAFFRHGVSHLRPLILRDIAGAVQMHESTVSRVTANKYIATPRGTLELKFFFTTAIAGTGGGESHSAEAVRHRIRDMITTEDPENVLSDDQIVAVLKREGVDIARRTVAKYRESLRIPSSVQRRREKAIPA
ncbi:RNA polymerase factor sigma-54 [Elioraea sp.]|uniref:RNA polymerase factor sigma-54 n=1 Tax=Elioraea sp. TaxID=2185103 RepID=UPI0025B99972|nr:RNA polymerase factor sigma-54 [Elioraea sp.]